VVPTTDDDDTTLGVDEVWPMLGYLEAEEDLAVIVLCCSNVER